MRSNRLGLLAIGLFVATVSSAIAAPTGGRGPRQLIAGLEVDAVSFREWLPTDGETYANDVYALSIRSTAPLGRHVRMGPCFSIGVRRGEGIDPYDNGGESWTYAAMGVPVAIGTDAFGVEVHPMISRGPYTGVVYHATCGGGEIREIGPGVACEFGGYGVALGHLRFATAYRVAVTMETSVFSRGIGASVGWRF